MGVVSTLVVMATFLQYMRTPLVMASGRELSFILLCGCLLCFAMTFIFLLRPTPLFCALQRFGMTLSFAVTYSALLIKTNRISRIFHSARLSARRPAMISPASQVDELYNTVQQWCAVVLCDHSPVNNYYLGCAWSQI